MLPNGTTVPSSPSAMSRWPCLFPPNPATRWNWKLPKRRQLTLAFITNRSDVAASRLQQIRPRRSLSPAGKLIGNPMAGIEADGKRARPPLNGSAPLVEAMPKQQQIWPPYSSRR